MGFKIQKVTTAKPVFDIHLSVNVLYEDAESPETENVVHYLRMPEKIEREKYQQMLVKVRGQNVKAQGSISATFWLWTQCMTKLEGYEDLPPTREQIINLFENNAVLHIHAEKAAEAVLEKISAVEDDLSKK